MVLLVQMIFILRPMVVYGQTDHFVDKHSVQSYTAFSQERSDYGSCIQMVQTQ